jgi:hypothetical protein
MSYELLEKVHSKVRLERYLSLSKGDKQRAFEYYIANIELSTMAMPLLHMFEVTFRNTIHTSITKHYQDKNWLLKLPTEIEEINGQKTRIFKDIQVVKERLLAHDKFITSDRIISELSLGFWVEFFYEKYDTVLGNATFSEFRNRQTGYNRKQCYEDLIFIRAFRNRVSHHDTLFIEKKDGQEIILKKRTFDFINKTLSILEQIDPDARYAAKKFGHTDRLKTKIASIE